MLCGLLGLRGSQRPVNPMSKRSIIGVCMYSGLHVASWRVLLGMNSSESWGPAFSWFFALFFLPLNLIAFPLCRLVWGTTDIFEARLIVGLMVDFAVASLLAVTLLWCTVAAIRRRAGDNIQ